MDFFLYHPAMNASFRAECAGFFLRLSRFLRQTPAHAVEESLFDLACSNTSTQRALLRTAKGSHRTA